MTRPMLYRQTHFLPQKSGPQALACYGLAQYGFRALALEIAQRVTATLAADLRDGAQWHEAYSTDSEHSGAPLAAAGFLSWDTLGAELLTNLRRGVNPFKLAKP